MDETTSDELDQMSDEERAVMEQWESMADDDAPEADIDSILEADATPAFDGGDDSEESEGGTRILNQEEIDSLLGFGCLYEC